MMTKPNESALVECLKDNGADPYLKRRALSKLLNKIYEPLAKFAIKCISTDRNSVRQDIAKDLVQETFKRFYEKIELFDFKRFSTDEKLKNGLLGYLSMTLFHLWSNHLKVEGKRKDSGKFIQSYPETDLILLENKTAEKKHDIFKFYEIPFDEEILCFDRTTRSYIKKADLIKIWKKLNPKKAAILAPYIHRMGITSLKHKRNYADHIEDEDRQLIEDKTGHKKSGTIRQIKRRAIKKLQLDIIDKGLRFDTISSKFKPGASKLKNETKSKQQSKMDKTEKKE